MATITHLDADPNTANSTAYVSNAFVPAAGDLLVVFVVATGSVDAAPTLTDSQGLGMTRIAVTAVWATSTHTIYLFVSNAQAAASSMTVTFDCSGDAATGAAIFVAGVQGMSRTGSNAVRQFKSLSNQTSGTTPAPGFAAAALTGNPTLGVVGNGTNPAGVTEPSGWTEHADVGYANPTTGAEYVSRNSGFTGTTITWGSTSASGFAVLTVELDASVPSTIVTPSTAALTVATFAPTLKISIVPATVALVVTALAPALKSAVIPAIASLSITSFQPAIGSSVIPAVVSLSISSFAPKLFESVTPTVASLTLTTFAPSPATVFIPGTASLTITTNASLVLSGTVVIPATLSLSITTFAPSVLPFKLVWLDPGGDAVQAVGYFNTDVEAIGRITFDSTQKVVGVGSYKFDSDDGTLQATASVAGVLGAARRVSTYFRYDSVPDAIETVTEFPVGSATYSGGGFFHSVLQVETATIVGTITGSGNATFTVIVAGVPTPVSVAVLSGDTAADVATKAAVALNADVTLGAYATFTTNGADLILTVEQPANDDGSLNIAYTNDTCTGLTPDATSDNTVLGEFTANQDSRLNTDNGDYGQARPAQNSGAGAVFSSLGLDIPIGAVIDSVKIIYERKYDTAASIGISRVKYRIDGVEGPDHDNTVEPLTDTVVTVDVIADRAWTWQDLQNGVFEVIAEARRGDTATAHTQSWDYVKVEVQYHLPTAIFAALNSTSTTTAFRVAITPKGAGCVLSFVDGAGESYDGITQLDIDTWNRISCGFIQHGVDDLDIKLYVNGIEELSIVGAATGGTAGVAHLHHGWIFSPGANHLCWFDVLHIDDGDDLSDCGNKLSTYKGPASTNQNNWNTTLGTGAVNERPLSETNGKQHTAVTGVRQSYTLQAASVGDVDLTGETLVGYMAWAWAKMQSLGESVFLIVNGVDVERSAQILTTPSLLKHAVTSATYPSNAAGIGMLTNEEGVDTWLYECGVVVAYEGPVEDQILSFQLLAQDSITDLTDDLRAAPPSSYELCCRSSDSSTALATVTVSSLDQEDGSIQEQAVIPCNGGIGRVRITPGIEVQVHIEVTGGDISLGLWHRLNVD